MNSAIRQRRARMRQAKQRSREVSMTHWLALGAIVLFMSPAHAQQREIATSANVAYVEHDGVKLTGDLYLPKGVVKAPLIIGIHGGGWQNGSPAAYQHWGPYLA